MSNKLKFQKSFIFLKLNTILYIRGKFNNYFQKRGKFGNSLPKIGKTLKKFKNRWSSLYFAFKRYYQNKMFLLIKFK